MFGNLVNRHDGYRVARKLRRGQLDRLVSKVRIRGTERVVTHWSAVDPSLQEWWAIPAVVRRWNTFASGDPETGFPQHVADKWLAGRTGLRALSLGCGTGGNEVIWARLGVFEHITGVDISPDRIAYATGQAEQLGLADVLSFRAADVRELLRAGETYDIVLGLQSLHHFDRLDRTMDQIAGLLNPGGLLVVDEFVGPTKFQWTSGQLRAVDTLLAELPPERRRLADGRLKRRAVRPSLLSMRLDDPSEAVDAGRLLPALRNRYRVLEERPYGGTVLHVAFSGIAQNFRDGSDAERALIERCFAAEDAVLPELGHDFVFMVCEPKPR
ncbi:class I SAM-dependent methyltransferase [Kitasatospora sp. GP82]|uniref:class I SAM-dependent methyltransferase n=1 Tax=Kitasatospora sp. GP82 TaxID=3035089 RepID=UPI002473CD50|nr:class I SAM-dependent methyltransferase [Kitasatospora sp. GP82]MDH6123746.1 2-polyprenyl-3-methyl-5-hydroxy-6-metoxy-1,4-benzoquinol methylase [Kitasatospora sp. GP82]